MLVQLGFTRHRLCGSRDILYSPLVAAFFSTFAFVSQNVTEVLWRLVLGLGLPLALWFSARTLFDFSKKEFAWLFLLIVPLTLSSLNNGQANIIIIVLFLVAAGAASQSRWFICFSFRSRPTHCSSMTIGWRISRPIVVERMSTTGDGATFINSCGS